MDQFYRSLMMNYGMSIKDIDETDYNHLCRIVINDKSREERKVKTLFEI